MPSITTGPATVGSIGIEREKEDSQCETNRHGTTNLDLPKYCAGKQVARTGHATNKRGISKAGQIPGPFVKMTVQVACLPHTRSR
jgi:hypothetical protein